MPSSINSSFSSHSHISQAQRGAERGLQRLASGKRINSAMDDAAGLAISDRMSSQVRGLNQAVRNANDGISMAQTADGALGETTSVLQRMRDLSVQAANGSYNDTDRQALNDEFSQLKSELDRIAEETTFNGQTLLDGSNPAGAEYHVGANENQSINVTIDGASQLDLGTESLDLTSASNAGQAMVGIDDALDQVSSIRGELSSVQNRFESSIANLENVAENISASNSRIADADMAAEISEMMKNRILQKSGVAMQSQANQQAGGLIIIAEVKSQYRLCRSQTRIDILFC